MSIPAKLVLCVLIFIAGIASGIKYQSGELAKLRLEQTTKAMAAAAEARATEARYAKTIQDAQNAQTHRTRAAQAAAAAARNELDRLRSQLAQGAGAGPESAPACTIRAAAVSDVLSECAGAYLDLAGKADAHANDVRTLIDAWPK